MQDDDKTTLEKVINGLNALCMRRDDIKRWVHIKGSPHEVMVQIKGLKLETNGIALV